jgi:hypothetical protein
MTNVTRLIVRDYVFTQDTDTDPDLRQDGERAGHLTEEYRDEFEGLFLAFCQAYTPTDKLPPTKETETLSKFAKRQRLQVLEEVANSLLDCMAEGNPNAVGAVASRLTRLGAALLASRLKVETE